MPASESNSSLRAEQRQRALQRWDTEGGAGPGRLPAPASIEAASVNDRPVSRAEFVQLQTRVIALENLVIVLLAGASDADLGLVRAMATHIAPRAGFTSHPLTVGAAAEMMSLARQSRHFATTSRADESPLATS